MVIRRLLALLVGLSGLAHATTFETRGADSKTWAAILGSVGFTEAHDGSAGIVIAPAERLPEAAALAQWHIVILEGSGAGAAAFGISAKSETIKVRQIEDEHAPKMQIIWESPVDVPRAEIPADFQIFAKEKWTGAPLVAGKRIGHGAVLWLATDPGATGIERFPYLLQALQDLGWSPAAESVNLWAFFDSAYRVRADPEYLAHWWRRAGISVLHAAAWHNMEPDAGRDEYLAKVITACHHNAISVYAWLELPHVSEAFWDAHPEWREKTAAGQDAQLDWRKLMNLENPQCRAAVATLVQKLLARFDWDGVNLAELYFESLEGASNPARFTPMNNDVRAEFQQANGFDPKLLFDAASAYAAASHPEALRKFLDFRAALATRMQQQWLDVVAGTRAQKPYLDTVVTHIDDRFDTGIRDELGADVAKTLPLITARRATLLVEDPAPLWALGPERYAKLAAKYRELTSDRNKLAVDINIVERYQDVYPTKKQTGVELFELLHQAAVSFGQVALYFENSLEKQDLGLVPAAAANAPVTECGPDQLQVDAAATTRVRWSGPVTLDGKIWPLQDAQFVLVPAGKHTLAPAFEKPPLTIGDFNGEIRSVLVSKDRIDVSYQSHTRAIAIPSLAASGIEVDGERYVGEQQEGAVMLPAGQHLVSFLQ
ncbi:MAG TPA: hypothetical protein VKX25_17660 [Bryobacteraceae bacterium]|jgi:hypothetical protein|nr:hypothetical protein [Bryobacteraceae bacterium]